MLRNILMEVFRSSYYNSSKIKIVSKLINSDKTFNKYILKINMKPWYFFFQIFHIIMDIKIEIISQIIISKGIFYFKIIFYYL
jgi:hypothetical protein